MPRTCLLTLSQAISQFVHDGDSIVMGTSLEAMIPFAAGHEIIRQRLRDLTLIGPISDMLFDQLIGAGCVRWVRAAWVGNVITGLGYNFRRAAETDTIRIEDHSNLTIAMALKAGALGIPFMPVRTALGSDLPRTNPSLKLTTCPFSHTQLMAVAAIIPDVAIVHVQRADAHGNAHVWGNFGLTREACLASRRVILTAEEIVAPDVIAADPNREIVPAFRVNAVVHVPYGAHPSPVPGHYNRDHRMFIEYRDASRTPFGDAAWRQLWISDPKDRVDYLHLLGEKRLARLALKHHLYAPSADFGY